MDAALRQSTSATIMLGPILDADGVAKTDEVVGSMRIAKAGGVPATLDGSATLTHRHTGHYSLTLTANDTDTVGLLEVTINSTTNAMPIRACNVVEEAIYDGVFASGATALGTAASQSAIDSVVDQVLEDTAELQTNQGNWLTATSVTVSDKTGFKLASDGLDSITATEPTGKPTTFPGWVMWLVQRFRRAAKSTTEITVKTEAGADVTTQTITDDGAGTETLGPPS